MVPTKMVYFVLVVFKNLNKFKVVKGRQTKTNYNRLPEGNMFWYLHVNDCVNNPLYALILLINDKIISE